MNWVGFPDLGIDKIEFYPYISIFGFEVYIYGIIIAIGMGLAMVYGFKKAGNFGIDSDKMTDVVIFGIIGGIVGARIYYVIFSWDVFKDNIWSIFDLRSGGLAIYGGIIGAILVGGIACKIKKLPLLPMLDIAGIGFLLGQGIGRWGNFFNVEAYGGHTELPWGMIGNKIPDSIAPVHPTFLYESIWCLLGFILLSIYAKRRKFDGEVFLLYLCWYGFERFFVEGLRTDSLWLIEDVIRVSQALSAVLFVLAVATLLFIRFYIMKKYPKRDYLYVQTEVWQKSLIEKEKQKRERRMKYGGKFD